jgi:hypothetical protein
MTEKDKVVNTRDKNLKSEAALIKEAKERFRLTENYERENRKEAIDDLNMLAGKNHWPADIVRKRELADRPVLTINKLPSFVDQVTNNSRLSKMAIKVHPYGGGSTPKVANTIAGLIRNIEQISDADVAYQTGAEGSANNGFGYIRVVTSFTDESSFEQELKIKRVRDPLTVRLDPHHVEANASDIRFAFVEEKISRAEYKVRWSHLTSPISIDGDEGGNWVEDDLIRIAEYWVKEPLRKRLYLLSDHRTVDGDEWDSVVDNLKAAEKIIHLEPNPQDPQGQPIEVEGPAPGGSDFPQTVLNPTPTITRQRTIDSHKVVQYLIDGEKIIDGPTDWPGRFIPIAPVWGKEIIIANKRHLRGVIRFAKDPQRMYNYFRTAATETVALAPKAPYIMEERQIEGHEQEWGSLGRTNLPYLLFKGIAGQVAPTRQVVTQTAIGEITESNLSNDEMKATTSLFDASLGAQGNEVSGRAIQARQYKGDLANFTYQDNLARAIKFIGEILVDLIPRVYDTERQLMILNDDDTEEMVLVNQDVEGVIINDLSLGRYKVTISVGPSFATQRLEATQSMLDFMRVAPDAASLIMDLVAENMDWPGAIKIAKRFKKMLPEGIDDDAPAQPQQPSIDDIIKDLKSQGITLGNEIKKLKIIKDRRDLTDHDREMAEGGAQGALSQLGLFGDENE